MVAELGSDGGGRGLAFFELFERRGKLRHIGIGWCPAQFAALLGRAFVLRVFARQGIKGFTGGQLGLHGAGFVGCFHEDVAGVVFDGIALFGRDAGKNAVVFGFGGCIADGVIFLVLLKQHGRQQGTAGAGHFFGVFARQVQLLAFGLLHDDRFLDQMRADLSLQIGGQGLMVARCLCGKLRHHGVQPCLGNGFAIDDGHVLSHSHGRAAQGQQG